MLRGSLAETRRPISIEWVIFQTMRCAQLLGPARKIVSIAARPNSFHFMITLEPLYASVPGAARRNPALYDLLALVDALRIGRARERNLAEKEISALLNLHGAT